MSDLMSGGQEFILTYYNDMIGMVTSEVPEAAKKLFKDKLRTLEEI